jgi:CheY-like chemotaxis protein
VRGVDPGAAAAPAVRGRVAGSPPPLRILAVEDSPSARKVFQGVLLGLGIRPEDLRVAADAQEGLRIAAEWPPDVVFLDMELRGPPGDGPGPVEPAMNGDGLGRALLRAGRPPKVVVVTALDPDNPRVRGLLAAGAVAVIVKPVRATQVDEILNGIEAPTPPSGRGALR